MASLKKFLIKKKFVQIAFQLKATNHFELEAEINGVSGNFILDTGASNTCVGLDKAAKFMLQQEESVIKAAGAGAIEMETYIAKKNELTIGLWSKKKQTIVLFDLTHVNEALLQHNATPVDGIIGADILKKGKAVIDYKKKRLYLKV